MPGLNELPSNNFVVESVDGIVRLNNLLSGYNDTFPELLRDFCIKLKSYGLDPSEVFIIPEYFENEETACIVEAQIDLIDKQSNVLIVPAESFIIRAVDESSFLALYNIFSKRFTSSTMLSDRELRRLIERLRSPGA